MDSGVLEALRNTSKGRLSYSPKWDRSSDAERLDLLRKWTSPPPLSPNAIMCLAERTHRLSLQCKTNQSATPPSSSPPPPPHSNRHHSMPNTPLFQNSTLRNKLVRLTEGDSPLVSPTATPAVQIPETPAPVVMEMSVLAEQEHKLAEQEQSLDDQMWREKEERLEERRAFFRSELERIRQEAQEALLISQAAQRREAEVEKARFEAYRKKWKQEIDREIEKWTETYRQDGEELEAKLRKGVEQKKEILKRMDERRKQAIQKLHQDCQQMKKECVDLLHKFQALHHGCPFPQHLPDSAAKAYQMGSMLVPSIQGSVDEQQRSSEPDERKVALLRSHLTSVYPLLAELNSGVEEAVQRGQQEAREREKQQQQQQQQKQQQQQQQQKEQQQQQQKEPQQKAQPSTPVAASAASSSAPSESLGMPQSMLKVYSHLQETLSQVTSSCAVLSKDSQLKKYRFDLQKAISTPINAISGQSGEHLMDKIRRLHRVLSGERVQVTGKTVSASDHPQGKAYCCNLLAQKIVKQGEEQVSSRSEAAFPVAGVAVYLWVAFPELGELILAHFHSSCPVLVPFYIPKKDGMSDAEHYRLLGFKVSSDGQMESEDNYLKRMSGMVRLYAAILQTPTEPQPHPHGLEHGWAWFARILNMEPHPTLSSSAIYDMLEIAGHALLKKYGKQFQKLLYVLCKDYMPKIEKVTPPSQQGPFARLKLFLEECVSTGSIAPPKGVLTQEFWKAHSHGIAIA